MRIETVPVDEIRTGYRFRADYGDLEGLAQSIGQIGLLQPIGVDKYYKLVFGARRLEAARRIGWTEIPAHVVDVESLLIGEYSENEFRKEFTPSERLAIADAVKEELGNRAGRPLKLIPEDLPELKGKETREVAAKRAGFGNERTYRKAAKVVELGAPELVEAMDKGQVSIDAAEVIATEVPREKQAEVVTMPKDQRKAAVRDARAKQEAERMRKEGILMHTFERWVKDVATFAMDPQEFWAAASRNHMPDFMDQLDSAINSLMRLKEAHPNAVKRPRAVRS
jgi:ParB-like chromosome segregation protein Spo0J